MRDQAGVVEVKMKRKSQRKGHRGQYERPIRPNLARTQYIGRTAWSFEGVAGHGISLRPEADSAMACLTLGIVVSEGIIKDRDPIKAIVQWCVHRRVMFPSILK
jgi:hypothetical protein